MLDLNSEFSKDLTHENLFPFSIIKARSQRCGQSGVGRVMGQTRDRSSLPLPA